MRVCFDGVADVERAFRLDITYVRTLPESNAVHYIVRFIIHQFQFDVLLITSHHLACSVVVDMVRTENRFHIVRTERIESFQIIEELG